VEEATVLVREIMTRPVVTVTPETSVTDALALVAEHHISDLPVVAGDQVVGMVSEIDLIRFAIPLDPRSKHAIVPSGPGRYNKFVRQVMSAKPYAVQGDSDVSDVVRTLDLMRWKSVPVIEDGELIGIVTRGDVVRALVPETAAEPATR
jgi:CBS domain-containing protein